jgi:hypothetical protein
VKNKEVVQGTKKERNILNIVQRNKAKWIGHKMRRNCLLKHIIEGRIQGRIDVTSRRKQLLNDLKETKRFWKLKVEALDC